MGNARLYWRFAELDKKQVFGLHFSSKAIEHYPIRLCGRRLDSKSKYPPDNLHLINQVRTWPVPMPIHL
jgi:hypothetical protein